MIRKPLRPLAGVLRARAAGGDPDALEAHRRAERQQALRATERRRAEWRLTLLGFLVLAGFLTAAGRMAAVATSDPSEPTAGVSAARITAARADIVDRAGRVLATNLPTRGLYVQPSLMIDPAAAAEGLAAIFPELEPVELEARIRQGRFFWVRQSISPEQRQRVHELGEPGLQFAPREMRLYPAGRAVSHVLGGAAFGQLDVSAAELLGTAGVEHWFDARLRDPAQAGVPLALSLDLSAQVALREVLARGVETYKAKGAAGIVMSARTGEVVAIVSLPDFDPNARPRDAKDPRLFNRAVQGLYELGSTFKLFTAALAMDRGVLGPESMVNTQGPLVWGRFKIRDFHRMPAQMSLRDVIVESSNTGTARVAMMMGVTAQQDFLRGLGFLEPTSLQLSEASQAKPMAPPRWSELSMMTISFGHGLAATPLHLAAGYASLANGGLRVRPTLVKGGSAPTEADRVVGPETSRHIREMLRAVVTDGTGRNADVPGYLVGGKTGTADKPQPGGGYARDKVIQTFAAVFPMNDPEYVVVISIDEGSIFAAGETRRTAGWIAAPLAGETIRRIAPILGMRPLPPTAPEPDAGATLVSN